MGARYNVTNKAKGPRGFREEGKSSPTTVQVGETRTLIVDAIVEARLLELQEFGLVTLSRLADLPTEPAITPAGSSETPPATAPAPASDAPAPTAATLAAEIDRQNAEAAAEQARVDADKLRQPEVSDTEDDTDEEVVETEPDFTDEQIESWKPELLRSYITEKTGEAPAASCNTKTLINKAKAAAAPKAAAPAAPEEAV